MNVLCTAFWVPCRVIHIIRCYPTSWTICFDSWLKGLNDWLCRRSRWRASRFGWFSIFSSNSRTLTLCASFTTECGSPGILKSMSASILSRIVSSLMLSVSASWYTSGTSCTATVSLPGCPDLSEEHERNVFLVKIPTFDGKHINSSQYAPRHRSLYDDNFSATPKIVQYEKGHTTSHRNSHDTFDQYQSMCSEMTSFRTLINILSPQQRHTPTSVLELFRDMLFRRHSKVVIFIF